MNWRLILSKNNTRSIIEQEKNKAQVIRAFKKMWEFKPTMQEFSKYTKGLVLFPELLYIMSKPIKKPRRKE